MHIAELMLELKIVYIQLIVDCPQLIDTRATFILFLKNFWHAIMNNEN